MLDKLLMDVKLKINVTWDDDETNKKIKNLIEDAIITLNHKLGAEIDYSKNGMEHTLFLNYCMYAWNDCLHNFDNNYKSEIYQIRNIYEVRQYAKS